MSKVIDYYCLNLPHDEERTTMDLNFSWGKNSPCEKRIVRLCILKLYLLLDGRAVAVQAPVSPFRVNMGD